MTTVMFDDDWYHRIISQELSGIEEKHNDAVIIAKGIMLAGAMIAQAIDHAVETSPGSKDSSLTSLDAIAAAIEKLAEEVSQIELQ